MARTETKVQASTTAAAASGMALWLLGKYVFKGEVPDVIVSWVYVLVPGLLAWAAGYVAPHTHRPDLDGPQVTVPVRNSAPAPPVVPGEQAPG